MNIIVAYDKKNGIGVNNDLPWKLPTDMKHFSSITSQTSNTNSINIVIMGRNTWESIPIKYRPLKNRINIIVSSTMNNDDLPENTFVANSLNEALNYSKYNGNIIKNIINNTKLNLNEIIENVFVIGGERLYKEAILHDKVEKLYITEIYDTFDCDKHFPKIPNDFSLTNVSDFYKENGIYFRFLNYEKNAPSDKKWINHEEMQYINMLNYILEKGVERSDRTGVGTISTFGKQFVYDISKTFPLLTTKRIFVRAVFEELALYISGKTDNGILQNQNIHIWDGNTTRDFLDKRGLTHYPENDMGETYGFNFRHYGAEYLTCKEDYCGKGFDQLNYIVDQIKNNPTSRRIIINLWNPGTMHKAALPACLCMYQFYVDTKNKKLNLQIYIRSSDFFLANNWNTCTGSFLVYMICNLKDIDLTPGELSVITGDTHIYLSHVEAVKENLKRTPKPFPKLTIKEEKEKLEDYSWEDFKLIGYSPMPNISAPMAV